MKVIQASYQILTPDLDDPRTAGIIYRQIETAGRTCYKSEDKITDESAEKFVRALVKRGHEAMLEHASMTVKFIVDRGVSHELVRHRVASFAQESTRYCNYSQDKFGKEITVIEPVFFLDIPEKERNLCIRTLNADFPYDNEIQSFLEKPLSDHIKAYARWYDACQNAEEEYFILLELGCTPQEARAVLPNSLKTEVVMTANMREWQHFFRLRAAGESGSPHPQMLEVTVPLLNECRMKLPALFEDISPLEHGE